MVRWGYRAGGRLLPNAGIFKTPMTMDQYRKGLRLLTEGRALLAEVDVKRVADRLVWELAR